MRIDWECKGPQSGDGGQLGVGGFEVMLELMGICIELDDDEPLATYPQGSQWKVWTEKQATAALRAVMDTRSGSPRICVAFGSDRGRYTPGSHGVVDVRHPTARTLEEPGSGNVC